MSVSGGFSGDGQSPAHRAQRAQRPLSSSDSRPPLHAETSATEFEAAELRRTFSHWLAVDTPANAVADLGLVVYEALANVVEHAYADQPDTPGPLRIEAHRSDGQVLVIVTDEGTWRAPTEGDPTRGRGLPLMRYLTHEVTVDTNHHGTIVTLLTHLDSHPTGVPE